MIVASFYNIKNTWYTVVDQKIRYFILQFNAVSSLPAKFFSDYPTNVSLHRLVTCMYEKMYTVSYFFDNLKTIFDKIKI